MRKKNFFFNFILQFSLLFIILSLFYFEKLDLNKLNFLLTFQSFYIISLLFVSKLIISSLFFLIFKILFKKGDVYKFNSIYIKGGLVNEAVPGLGYFYRYKKLKDNYSVSLAEYGSVQTLNNIFILFSYLILALILGYLKIEMSSNFSLFLILTISLITFFIIIYHFRIKIFYIKKLKNLYQALSIIKKKIFKNYLKILLIFVLYFFQSLFQCYIFFKTILYLNFNLSFIDTSYLYISSFLATFLSFTNFIGIFELVLTFASSFFTDNYIDMWFVGINFRIMGIVALLLIIILFYFINFFKKYEKF